MALTDHYKFGDAHGDGYIRSEGVAAILSGPRPGARRRRRIHA